MNATTNDNGRGMQAEHRKVRTLRLSLSYEEGGAFPFVLNHLDGPGGYPTRQERFRNFAGAFRQVTWWENLCSRRSDALKLFRVELEVAADCPTMNVG